MSADPMLGTAFLVSLVGFLCAVTYSLPLAAGIRRLLVVGLLLRVVGAFAYFHLLGGVYGGGDYLMYFDYGSRLAGWLAEGDWERVLDSRNWWGGQWWGTQFVIFLTGGLVSVLGPSILGVFVVFALVGYAGIAAAAFAFMRAFPGANGQRYLAFVVLFPSLWFWPAALGKDAVVLCGVGLAALGFVGRGSRKRWGFLASGVFLVFAIRPQVAAVLMFAMMAGYWLSTGLRWRLKHVVQGAVLLAVGAATVTLSSGAMGIRLFNPQEVEAYFDARAEGLAYGGSAIAVSGGVSPWMAPINALFRPFLWEAQGMTSMLAAVEILMLWALAWWRRREGAALIRRYRRSPLFWLAVVFVAVYAVALGMAVTNLGMMARQRVHLLPFLLMFVAGAPALRSARGRRPAPVPPRPGAPLLAVGPRQAASGDGGAFTRAR